MKKIAFIKFGGLATGGTEVSFQNVAKNMSNKYKVDYFYCDSVPYIGSDYSHPDTSEHRKKFLLESKVNLIKFELDYKDVTQPTHPWINTNFWEIFNENNYHIVFATTAGPPEYPFTEIKNTPIINIVTLNAGVSNQKNILKSILISSHSAQVWKMQGGDSSRLEIIPLCREELELVNLDFRNELKLDSKFIYGLHQRDDDRIFSEIPLKAYKKVENSSNFFMILGGSKLYSQQANNLNIKNFLQLPHTGENLMIEKFLSTLNVYTHGRKHGETFGLAIAEAMKHGLPIISHKAESNAQKEVIGDCGKVFHKRNIFSYSKEMKKLEMNEDYYKEKSKCSLLRYDIHYSTKSVVSKYEKLVNEIIV